MNDMASPHNDLSLVAMSRFVARNIKVIALWTSVFTVAGVVLAYSLTPLYRSEVVVSPADSSSGLGQLGGQLGGLASLAGINIGGGGSKKSDEALEYLRSHVFTAQFIERHALMPVLFANKWDAARGQWRSSKEDTPTIAEGVARFAKKVRQVSEDRRTGMVTLTIIWSDRTAAAQWANWMIAEADKDLRERAIAQQSRSIEYLKAEAAQTTSVEVANSISKVMETELKNAMLARTRDAYAFEVIDPAVASDPRDRDSPNRPLIAVLGAALGGVVGVIVAATRQRRRERPPP
jgi:uncharacterized protein involved in exopolysaccharide biosynthesis